MDHRPLPRPRLTPSAGPFHIREEERPMWQHIITGAISLAFEIYMQALEWVYIG